jgi:hypothetical protein
VGAAMAKEDWTLKQVQGDDPAVRRSAALD